MYLPFDVYSLKQTWTCLRYLEQVKKMFSQNGGLVVIYHGTFVKNITNKSKSKHWYS